MTDSHDTATVEESLRLGAGVTESEREKIVEHWSSLDSRLRSFRAGSVDLQLTIKERDTPSQRTTLEAVIAGWAPVIATSTHTDVDAALYEVRDDMIRQLTDAKNRTEPRQNRQRRSKDV